MSCLVESPGSTKSSVKREPLDHRLTGLLGRLEEADRLSRQAHRAGIRMGEGTNATIVWIVQLHFAGRYTARALETQAETQGYPEAQHPKLRLLSVAPYMLISLGQMDMAKQMYATLAPTIRDLPGLDALRGRFSASTMAAAVCFYLEERDTAPMLYEQLLPYRERWVVLSLGVGLGGCIAACLGGLAATMGDWKAAEKHFEYALRVYQEQGAPGELAITQADYALALYRRGRKRDVTRADTLVSQAKELAVRHGIALVDTRVAQIESERSSL